MGAPVTDVSTASDRRAWLLAALLGAAGVAHFVAPRSFDTIIPDLVPGSRRAWTIASGIAELVCATAVARRDTRRAGALATLVLFVAVFPANVQMAIDWWNEGTTRRLVSLARLPLQPLLVWWAWRVRQAGRSADGYSR